MGLPNDDPDERLDVRVVATVVGMTEDVGDDAERPGSAGVQCERAKRGLERRRWTP
ncbi:hypothetical protein D3C83_326920 [compost metagenome]